MKEYYQKIAQSLQFGLQGAEADKTYLITYTHILENSVTFFQTLPTLGLKKENLFILGKPYSTVPKAEAALKAEGLQVKTIGYPRDWGDIDAATDIDLHELVLGIKKQIGSDKAHVIVMESGGVMRQEFYETFKDNPNVHLTGLELTTQGDYHPYLYPTVDVALCRAKKELEKFCVAENILDNFVRKGLMRKDWIYGVIGYGAIGGEVAEQLRSQGFEVKVFDINKQAVPEELYSDLELLLPQADCIIGTTGHSSLNKDALPLLKKETVLVSTSSRDTEFIDFLRETKVAFRQEEMFDDLEIKLPLDKKIILINGGFPINYNRLFAANEYEMAMVYGLWLAGMTKAYALEGKAAHKVPLSKEVQALVVKIWLDFYKDKLLPERVCCGQDFLVSLGEGNKK